jgi:hypothetical protein
VDAARAVRPVRAGPAAVAVPRRFLLLITRVSRVRRA